MIKKIGKKYISIFGKAIISNEVLDNIRAGEDSFGYNLDCILNAYRPGAVSYAQLRQDVVALMLSNFKDGGYFVEFGATNGRDLSNTALLEESFGWSGILAEPGRNWHKDLFQNRSCHIDKRCVWGVSGKSLDFFESDEGEYSSISRFINSDHNSGKRVSGKKYVVETISLKDLLSHYSAPHQIDYLSLDVEGAEYEILKGFDMSSYDIRFVSCEHNFTPERERIRSYFEESGYRRILENFSRWDDWYVQV